MIEYKRARQYKQRDYVLSKLHPRPRQCSGKKRYDTKEIADKRAYQISKEKKERLHSYYCGYCKGYHIGHE